MAAAQPPAAVGSTGTTGALVAVGMGALAEILPRSVTAGENTTGNHFYFGGYITRGDKRERFIYYDYPAGGGGSRYGKDGIDATGSLRTGNIDIQSVEVLESAYPVLQFKRWRLWTGSGGPGKFRGGQGQIREYETEENGVLSILLSQCMVPAGGLFGGHAGSPNGCKVIRDNDEIDLAGPPHWGKVTGFPIEKGDLIRMQMSGGGGYGDPLDRDPARIVSDVFQGLLTVEQAHDVYGVVVEPETLDVDEGATRDMRSSLTKKRLYLEILSNRDPVYVEGVRRVLGNPILNSQGIHHKDLVELVGPGHPCPLRARIELSDEVDPAKVSVDEEACRFYRIKSGDRMELRPLLVASDRR